MSLVASLPRLPRIDVPRWVFVVLGAVLVALLVWLVGPLVAVAGHAPLAGWPPRLVVIALIALGVGAYYAIRRWRATRANGAMVDELASTRTAAPVEDDLSAEGHQGDGGARRQGAGDDARRPGGAGARTGL